MGSIPISSTNSSNNLADGEFPELRVRPPFSL